MLSALTTLLHRVSSKCAPLVPPVADAKKQWPAAHRTPAENFKTMPLLYRFHGVDDLGRWWRIETRQCPFTGTIIREQTRISD